MPVSQQHFAPPVVENTLSHLDPVANWLQLTSTCSTPLATLLLGFALALHRPGFRRFPGFCCLFFADRAGAFKTAYHLPFPGRMEPFAAVGAFTT